MEIGTLVQEEGNVGISYIIYDKMEDCLINEFELYMTLYT
jgi:hypothetical protein